MAVVYVALAANVQLTSTFYLWSDSNRNLFLTDTSSQVVLRIAAFTNVMTIVVGVVDESRLDWEEYGSRPQGERCVDPWDYL